MSLWSLLLPLLCILPAVLFIYGFFRKKVRKPLPKRLGTRGRQLLKEQIPVFDALSEAQKEKIFEQVIRLNRECAFYIGLGDPPTSEGFVKMKSDEKVIFLGQLALLTLHRRCEFPAQLFPIAITADIIVQTDPIVQGSLGTTHPRTVMSDDITLNSALNVLGLSAFAFQIAKFMDDLHLSSATAAHRAEYYELIGILNKAYDKYVVAPAVELQKETGETPEIPTPYYFLLDQQKKFFGTFSGYERMSPEVRAVLDVFYGERRQLH